MLRIDAHHHLWRYDADEFAWLDDSMKALRRDFTVEDLECVLPSGGVQAAVAVQARQGLRETRFLLQCAKESAAICAVVGWVPLGSAQVSSALDEFSDDKKFVGVREIVQGQPKGFLDDAAFNRGIEELSSRELTYDILVSESQIEEVIRFVDRHPRQRFVLDHAAKPKIAAREVDPWKAQITELAKRENVFCKISGLVTEAIWTSWTLEDLRPYLDVCVEAFGVERMMAGSDWPVCLVASGYAQWWRELEVYFGNFSKDEQARVFGLNAMKFYQLQQVEPTERKAL